MGCPHWHYNAGWPALLRGLSALLSERSVAVLQACYKRTTEISSFHSKPHHQHEHQSRGAQRTRSGR
eukprot:362649-Chlamydomonas_euryale.AAC.5